MPSPKQHNQTLLAAVKEYESARRLLRSSRIKLLEALNESTVKDRASAWTTFHRASNMLEESQRYFSQCGQDRILDAFFLGKNDGVFVDIGSFDGITGSNTLFFEMFRQWRGLCVEPSPGPQAFAKKFRRSRFADYAIGGKCGSEEFIDVNYGYTQMSGLAKSYNSRILEKVRSHPDHIETILVFRSRLCLSA